MYYSTAENADTASTAAERRRRGQKMNCTFVPLTAGFMYGQLKPSHKQSQALAKPETRFLFKDGTFYAK